MFQINSKWQKSGDNTVNTRYNYFTKAKKDYIYQEGDVILNEFDVPISEVANSGLTDIFMIIEMKHSGDDWIPTHNQLYVARFQTMEQAMLFKLSYG